MNTPQDSDFSQRIRTRHKLGKFWQDIFKISTYVGIIALLALMINIANGAFGYVVVEYKIHPEELAIDDVPLEKLDHSTLVQVFKDNVSNGLYRRFESEGSFEERTREEMLALINEWVLEIQFPEQWGFWESLFKSKEIRIEAAQKYPDGELQMRSWLSIEFLKQPQSEDAIKAGVRTAALGSLWTISIAILFSFPVGVSAAIYLEEYSEENFINRIIRTNINNLAGVPSIIYGMLGLAIFVRALERLTSGSLFGMVDPTTANGRTILSAGLTLGLLVLPLIIINSQEAIKSVPKSLRLASYGLGATKFQTIWSHVLPNSISGILTGTILAISRAIGETAPLIVVGASTFIRDDPTGPFSKFTTLPIQIYQWTSRPQDVFRNLAAAAIILLLILLLSLNSIAIFVRNHYSRRL